ncbi:hypothetical protein M408DRAFT_331062 [Serendipita vermifera MAFF 305830]|uniref:Uncharacterized protein n=1 Tax=Serendipita vermifera MAFF 305830 TaxID=933852 RepID=A0A0C2WH55_SERVB|nr:hypothetical protein M408DRAFT_331062 [Serendipita vermifera MAFF 305830]
MYNCDSTKSQTTRKGELSSPSEKRITDQTIIPPSIHHPSPGGRLWAHTEFSPMRTPLSKGIPYSGQKK